MTAFRSMPINCEVYSSGWVDLPSGVSITRMPIWDTRECLFARLGHGPAADFLAKLDMRLPTRSELDELHALSRHIHPYTLPTASMTEAAGVPRPWMDKEGQDTPQMAAYRAANMMSLAWCSKHDNEVWGRLADAQWGDEPVANAGKHWVKGGYIYGWWLESGAVIQPYSGFHKGEPTYVDYATTFHAVRECQSNETVIVISSTPPGNPAFTRKGDHGVAVTRLQLWLLSQGYDLPQYGADGDHGRETEDALSAWRADQMPDTEREPSALPYIEFRQARNYRKGRRAAIDLIVIHVGELAEDLVGEDTNAEALMNYCATTTRQVSWGYSVDSDSITQSVKDEDTAWHAGGGGVNDRSIGIETSGYTAQTSAEWHDVYSQKMLALVAKLVAELCRRHGVPVRKLDVAQLKAGERGICGHVDIRDAFHQTTHSDPGRGWPWSEFVDMVKQEM